MSRPRRFDRDQVLDCAMRMFWEKGVEATSIQDLVECMGIGRGSLYGAFGSKEQLLLDAMDRYVDRMEQDLLGMLQRRQPVQDILRDVLTAFVERGAQGQDHGCLLTKSALLTGRRNTAIMARVERFTRRLEDALHDLVRRGQTDGDVPADRCPRALARFLACSMQGIRVTAAMRDDAEGLHDIVEITLRVIRA